MLYIDGEMQLKCLTFIFIFILKLKFIVYFLHFPRVETKFKLTEMNTAMSRSHDLWQSEFIFIAIKKKVWAAKEW